MSKALAEYYSGSSIKDISDHLKQEHGYHPSKHIVWEWIEKYTPKAIEQFQDVHPKELGDTWIADETVLEIDRRKTKPMIKSGFGTS